MNKKEPMKCTNLKKLVLSPQRLEIKQAVREKLCLLVYNAL
jgi:hypothetical protein